MTVVVLVPVLVAYVQNFSPDQVGMANGRSVNSRTRQPERGSNLTSSLVHLIQTIGLELLDAISKRPGGWCCVHCDFSAPLGVEKSCERLPGSVA